MTATSGKQRIGWRGWLDVLVSVTLLAAGAIVLYKALWKPAASVRRDPPVPEAVQPLVLDSVMGSSKARAVLIEYADFQCPYCAHFARDVLPELNERYVKPGRLRVAFRHFPLENHAQALSAAAVAACADGAFWPAHDALFANQASLRGADLLTIASLAGLKADLIRPCTVGRGAERVQSDIASARALHVNATPTFFAGIRVDDGVQVKSVIGGARPLDVFVNVIDSILALK